MVDSRGPTRKKRLNAVKVHYFQKPERSVSTPPEFERTLTQRVTLPEMRAEEVAPRPTPDEAPRRRRSEKPAGRASKQRTGAEPTEKLRALPFSNVPERAMPGMTPGQIAEMCLFGHQLFEKGQISEARAIFEGIVGLGVRDAFPHTMLGTIYLANHDPDKALALFEESLSLDPGDIAAMVYRGEIRLGLGKISEAVKDFRKAIEVAPSDDPFVARARRLTEIARDRARRQRR